MTVKHRQPYPRPTRATHLKILLRKKSRAKVTSNEMILAVSWLISIGLFVIYATVLHRVLA